MAHYTRATSTGQPSLGPAIASTLPRSQTGPLLGGPPSGTPTGRKVTLQPMAPSRNPAPRAKIPLCVRGPIAPPRPLPPPVVAQCLRTRLQAQFLVVGCILANVGEPMLGEQHMQATDTGRVRTRNQDPIERSASTPPAHTTWCSAKIET